MKYYEIKIDLNPLLPAREVLYADLDNVGVESIVDTETGVLAYISENEYKELSIDQFMVNNLPVEISFSKQLIEDQNWNAKWESTFDPITINEKCVIRAPFHKETNNEYDIIISPQMSFGTGHHETTFLIAKELFELNLENKSVLDMGCGTAVLAILAEKLGAEKLDAIDIENWAFENALDNLALNDSKNIKVYLGDISQLSALNSKYDVVIANINRNVLMSDLPEYSGSMKEEGVLLLSGFFATDKPVLVQRAEEFGLKFDCIKEKNGWAMLRFNKK